MLRIMSLLICLLTFSNLVATAAPIPPPPFELDTRLEGSAVASPLEGAFWIPSTDSSSYLNLDDHPDIEGGHTSDLLSVRVSNAAGEEQSGAIFTSNIAHGNTMYFWRSATPLAEGAYQVELQATPLDGDPSSLTFQLEVAVSSADPAPSAGLMASRLSEMQLDDVVTCCETVSPLSVECNIRGCPVECWTESFKYVPHIEGSYQAVAEDRYESFTAFTAELTQPDQPRNDYTFFLSYADQLEEDSPLSLNPYQFEGEQLCVTIKWKNILTGAEGASETECFNSDEFEAIEHLTPSNEELNQAAMACFELPEGYPLATDGGDHEDPKPNTDQEVAAEEGGCEQEAAHPSLWIALLLLGTVGSVQRKRRVS